MATLTIRNLPDDVRDRLRVRAAQNGRSMEAEARLVLARAIGVPEPETMPPDARERARAVQEAFRAYRTPGTNMVDEFLSNRKQMWDSD